MKNTINFLFNNIAKKKDYIVTAISVAVILRGLFVLLLPIEINSDFIYWFFSLIITFVAFIGFIYVLLLENQIRNSVFYRLVCFNIVAFAIYTIVEINEQNSLTPITKFINFGLLVFLVFIYREISREMILIALKIITFILVGSIFVEYALLNLNLLEINSLEYAYELQKKLRPSFVTWSKSGDFYRANGLFALIPDNVGVSMAILTSFWITMTIYNPEDKLLNSHLAFVSFVSLVFSMTAANILALISSILIIFFIQNFIKNQFRDFFKDKKNKYYLITILFLILALYFGDKYGLNEWLRRVGKNGDWDNILNLRFGYLQDDMISLLFGHGSKYKNGLASVEIAFLQFIFEFGIVQTILLYVILLYPMICWLNEENQKSAINNLPYVAAVTTGFLTLAHYGSLFTTCNICIFYLIYSQAIKNLQPIELNKMIAIKKYKEFY